MKYLKKEKDAYLIFNIYQKPNIQNKQDKRKKDINNHHILGNTITFEVFVY